MSTGIPLSLARRPHYRGLPIPFVVHVDNGVPRFNTNNIGRIAVAIQQRLCGQCGEPLDGVAAFIGGPENLESRMFIEPPAHPQCARYALTVCPHLVEGFMRTSPPVVPEGTKQLRHGFESTPAPEKFLLYITRSFAPHKGDSGVIEFLAGEPTAIRWYAGGVQLSDS